MDENLIKKLILSDLMDREPGKNPWDQHELESDKQFQWFQFYVRFSPRRLPIISRVCSMWCNEHNQPFNAAMRTQWNQANTKLYWAHRRQAYWRSVQKSFDGKVLQLAEFHASEFENFAAHLKVQEWEKSQEMVALADQMLKRAAQMLDIPIVEEEVIEDEGGITIVIKPTSSFRVSDIPTMARAAAKVVEVANTLGRSAVEHIAESIGKDPGNVDNHFDVKKMSLEELEALKLGARLEDVKKGNFDLERLRAEHIRKNQ